MKILKQNILLIALLMIFGTAFSQNGKIVGKIYDKVNNEPLPFANIIISGTMIGTTSDLDGNFSFTGLNPGFVKLEASFVGYDIALSSDIQVTNANIVFTNIEMETSSNQLGLITVAASPYKRSEESPVSLQKIGLSDIENNPGSNRDIAKVIQSFPGIGSIANFRNDIIIRGGGPSEAVFYLDEIEIPNINHFATQGSSGGRAGIINADFISSVDFFSGAFPANRPDALSGLFELKQVDGNNDKLKIRATLGASEIALTADGPLGENTNYILSVRRSYLQFLFDAIGLPFLPNFTDYQFKLKTKINERNEIKIISIGALDEFALNLGLENPTEEQKYILDFLPVNEQWNYAIGTVYKHFSKNGYQTVVLSRNMLNNSAYKFYNNDETQLQILDYISQEIENKFRFENTTRVNGYKITFSFNSEYAKFNNNTDKFIFVNGGLLNISYSSDFDLIKYGASAQVSKNYFNERLTLSLGLRSDANNYSKSMSILVDQISPRFSANFMLTKKIAINLNAGRYFGIPAYTTMGYKDSDGILVNKENNLKYIQSDQIIGGLQYTLNSNTIFTVESFGKFYSQYPFSLKDSISLANKGSEDGVIGDEAVVSTGEGKAYGIEFMNRTKISNRLNFIFSYTWVNSTFKDRNGEFIPTTWDTHHIISITGSYNFKGNWSIGGKWRFLSGLPYTPYNLELSANKIAWDIQGRPYLDISLLNSLRLKEFHQLDIRIDKKFFFSKWSLMLYFDIQNAYNYAADQQDYVIRESDANGNYILENNGTTYKLKTIDSSSGLVLPTVGIMVEF
jgi:hypothetical protein